MDEQSKWLFLEPFHKQGFGLMDLSAHVVEVTAPKGHARIELDALLAKLPPNFSLSAGEKVYVKYNPKFGTKNYVLLAASAMSMLWNVFSLACLGWSYFDSSKPS
jgi:hypothetical protein